MGDRCIPEFVLALRDPDPDPAPTLLEGWGLLPGAAVSPTVPSAPSRLLLLLTGNWDRRVLSFLGVIYVDGHM